ncbi:PBECR2 nuclease fold domain-containing protein [Marinobacter sp.]|uniref:PBECR2 nuclease fold domain-containing protein n=1 Tax=Marinobacter sp. TaxID=50741 RepID=UPI0034A1271E
MASVNYGSLPFNEQIAFFRRKLDIPTTGWTDLYSSENDWGFAVAGANRNDLVADFRSSIDTLIAEGGTIESFRKDFDRIVADHGWDYNGGRNWRSRVIYQTNLYQSHNAGVNEQLDTYQADLPYRRYRHSLAAENPREQHLAWDGLILRADDPFWATHSPMNGWGCQCYVEGLTDLDLEEMGKGGPDVAPDIEWETREIGQSSETGPRQVRVPKGIDPGFEHSPGQSRLHNSVPPELPGMPASRGAVPGLPNRRPPSDLPEPRPAAREILPNDLPDADYAEAFIEPFGAALDQPVIYRDVLGEALTIGAELFNDRKTGRLNANQGGRGPTLPLMAEAIRNPDEVWVRLEHPPGGEELVVRRRYLARLLVPGRDAPASVVFEHSASGWSGMATFGPDAQDINDMRIGIRLYRRAEDEE